MKYKLLLFAACWLLPQLLSADNESVITVQDKNAQPINNVNICWQMPKNRKMRGFAITDKAGKVTLPVALGKELLVVASHVGYKTLIDTIVTKKDNVLQLEKDIFKLEQVVVTGHSTPIPIDSSLYSVRVIDKQKIANSGATSLGDLFFTEPNINLSSDFILGTKIEMFGMSGQNVKVMIDGVPVIGRLGGNIDLSQITVDNIDHVEIIEGPMSVVYGNNALAGTINVITDKKRYHTTEVSAGSGVESVGRFDGAVDVSQKIGENTLGVSGNYSQFDGVDFDKSDRAMEWKPTQQYSVNARYLIDLGKWNITLKGGVYNSRLTIKGDIQNYKAYDRYYYTDRYTGSVTAKGKWNKNNDLSVLVSHSYYDHSVQFFTKDMTTLKETKGKKISQQAEEGTLMRAVWNHQFQPKKLSMETGLDFNLSSMDGERIEDESKNVDNYAAFLNVRYSPLKNFELQPGIRVMHNTKFDAPILYSINAKWNMAENLSWRVSAAKGYRAPNVKELYLTFFHAGFLMKGNENLKAEKSDSYNMSLDYDLKWKENCVKASAKLYYNDVYDMIALARINNDTSEYRNVIRYKTRGGSLGVTFFHKDILRLNANGIVTARYNRLSKYSDSDKFVTAIDFIAGVQVKEPHTKIQLNANMKMYGKQDFYQYEGKVLKKANLSPYEMLNASLSRRFLKNRLNITVGAKNLLDVKTVKVNGISLSGGGHGSSDGSPTSFGTSYFVKANFKISR